MTSTNFKKFVTQEDKKLDLSKFKGHQRKFPWRLLFKSILMLGFVAMFYFVSKALSDKRQEEIKKIDLEIEVISN